jgi:tetratricopeptide (TPR) repeat protein
MKEKGDENAAMTCFKKVTEISPDYSWAYYNMAVIDWDNGNGDDCIENLSKTLQYNPKDVDAYKIFTKLLFKLGEMEKSKIVAEQAIDNCGGNGDLYYILAQVNKGLGQNDEYVKCMGQSLKYYQSLSVSPKLVKEELEKNK